MSISLHLLPIGEVPRELVLALEPGLSRAFGPLLRKVSLGLPMEVPLEAYNPRRGQYNANVMLRYILERMGGSVLAITGVDLYVPSLNFVFGLAQCPGRGALVSIHRLDPKFYGGQESLSTLLDRITKEAVHELGHVFGLAHCRDRECVMSFSNSIVEVDIKSPRFCNSCWRKLIKKNRCSKS